MDGVSFTISPGETLGLAGESGSGKSTVARALVRINRPPAGPSGWPGPRPAGCSGQDLRAYRRRMQMVYQDPYDSLDPRMSILEAIGEGLAVRGVPGPGAGPRPRTCWPGQPARHAGLARTRPAVRRPAPAGVHRARPGRRPRGHHLRRGRGRAGRVHPGPGAQPAQGHPGRCRGQLPVHLPRPVHAAVHGRPGGHHVRRAAGRVRHQPPGVQRGRSTPTPRP